jgi:hypothetical protein
MIITIDEPGTGCVYTAQCERRNEYGVTWFMHIDNIMFDEYFTTDVVDLARDLLYGLEPIH